MINKYFYNLSVTIVGIVTSIFVLTMVGGLFHIPVNTFYVFIPFIGGVYYLKKQSPENIDFLKQLLTFLLILMVSYFLALFIWDCSSDGRWYHSATLVMLKNGWLPVYNNFIQFSLNSHVHPSCAFWSNCYLKFVEIVGANIYKLTNLFESAKAINFIVLSAVFMYSFSVLKEFKPQSKFVTFISSCIIILNPVCICQWYTNFIDLHIYYAFILLLLTIIKIELQQKAYKTDLFLFVCSSLMLAMTKFTGCMYLFIVCLFYFVYLLISKRNIKKYIITVFLVGGLIAVTSVNPFYTNYRDFQNPFFPACGKNRLIIINNFPLNFENMSVIERFFRSNFSESVESSRNTDLRDYNQTVKLKIPFTINIKSSVYRFYFPDMRIGGFGYFWSGILLLSLFYLPFIRFRNKNERNIFCLMTSIIITSTLVISHNWWARLVPQFWLFPFFVMFIGILQENYRNKYFKIFKLLLLYFVMFSFIINSLIVLFQNIQFNLAMTALLKKPYEYINSNKKYQDKILLMVRPDNQTMPTIDETIIPHLEEFYGKESIVFLPFEESKISSEKFIPVQQVYVLTKPYYYFKIEKRP